MVFPFYIESRTHPLINKNYLYPFFNLSHGDGMCGWQVWPLVGHSHKILTTQTNGFGDIETNGGYDKIFALWPVYFRQNNNLGTADPEKVRAALPLYFIQRSPLRDTTSVLWPFFSWVEDRGKKYDEWQGPWPFVIIARGEGKTATRVWPLFGRTHNDTLEKNLDLWPLYKYKHLHSGALDEQRARKEAAGELRGSEIAAAMSDYVALIAALSVDADDLRSTADGINASVSSYEEDEVERLVSEAEELVDAVRDFAQSVD